MKKIYALSIFLLGFFGLNAQSQPKGFHLDKPVNMAAILAKKPSAAIGFSSVSEARSIINDIMDVSDIQQNFRVESTTQVDNAAAVIYQGVRYILYNPSFINELDNAARDKWASISVVGHEIGHHLLGHTLNGRGSQIPKELEADEFSGLVLRRMGASLQQAQLAMKLVASPYPSATHPGENDRLAAIERGWNSTTVKVARGNDDVAINTPDDRRANYPSQQDRREDYPTDSRGNYPSNRRSRQGDSRSNYPGANDGVYGQRRDQGNGRWRGNSSQNIDVVYDIRFNGNSSQQYFITAQNQVIMLRGYQAFVVAKIASTNRPNYPYVIYDDQQQIFIDRTGNLYLESGRRVGYVARH